MSLAQDMGLEGRDIFTVEKKALTTIFYLDADVDLSHLIGEENNRIFALFPPDMRFLLTLPVRPLAHNATSITADERTLEWALSLEGGNHIELAARAPNPRRSSGSFLFSHSGRHNCRDLSSEIFRRRSNRQRRRLSKIKSCLAMPRELPKSRL